MKVDEGAILENDPVSLITANSELIQMPDLEKKSA